MGCGSENLKKDKRVRSKPDCLGLQWKSLNVGIIEEKGVFGF